MLNDWAAHPEWRCCDNGIPGVCSTGKGESGGSCFQDHSFLKMVFLLICLPFGQKFSIFNIILLTSFWCIRTNRKKYSYMSQKTPLKCAFTTFWKSTGEIPPPSTGMLLLSPGHQPALQAALLPCSSATAVCNGGGSGERWRALKVSSLGLYLVGNKLVKMLLSVVSAANWRSRKPFLN